MGTNAKAEATAKKIIIILLGISTIITIIGFGLCLAGKYKAEGCTEKVIATCTNIKKLTSYSRGKTLYRYNPVFTYKYNNKTYEEKYVKKFTAKEGIPFEKGKTYTILVNPNDPKQYVVEGHESDTRAFGVTIIIVGITSGAIYAAAYLIGRKKYNNKLLDQVD